MHLSQSVPQEVWEQILAHLVDDRDTLEAVIQADCAASTEAQSLYWMNSLAMEGLLEELDDEPGLQRQTLANYVRNIIMDFEAPDADHRSIDLHFPLVCRISPSCMIRMGSMTLACTPRSNASSALACLTWRSVARHLSILIYKLSPTISCPNSAFVWVYDLWQSTLASRTQPQRT
jgi:hypothetical protein